MTSLVLSLWMLAAAKHAVAAPVSVPLVGDWELNLQRTHYGPTVERRTRERFTCTQAGDRLECVIRAVRAGGRETVGKFRGTLDGAPTQVTGIPDVDQVRLRVDGAVLEATFSLRGTPVFGYRAYRSDDGRSLTIVTVDPVTHAALQTVVVYDHR